MSENALDAPSTVMCQVCQSKVPDGEFCGVCGAHLVTDNPRAAQRHHAYAANPHEHVLNLNVVSTLFPHLPHRRSAPFRLALLAAAAALLVLGYLRFTGPSIAVAALAVPLLYLLYLYEVEVYEEEPGFIIGITMVFGIVLGFLWAHFTGPIVTRTALLIAAPQGAPVGRVLESGVLFPLVAQVLMLAGVGVIYLTRKYDEALDGFAFGAACALGFVLAATLTELWPEVTSGMTSVAPAIDNALRIVQRGLLIPFIFASTTGLIGGALWLRRGKTRNLPFYGWITSWWLAILISAMIQVGLGLVNIYVVTQAQATLIYFLIAVILLLCVRVALHHFLLAEAVDVGIGPEGPCSHCHRTVPRMAFCPHCGVATRSTPKTGSGRAGRPVR